MQVQCSEQGSPLDTKSSERLGVAIIDRNLIEAPVINR